MQHFKAAFGIREGRVAEVGIAELAIDPLENALARDRLDFAGRGAIGEPVEHVACGVDRRHGALRGERRGAASSANPRPATSCFMVMFL